MTQPVNCSGPLRGSRRVGDSTLSLDEMSLRDERCVYAPAVRRNAKLERLLGLSDTPCSIQSQQKQQGTRLRKKSSNNGFKTSKDPPFNAFQRFRIHDDARHTRASSPILGRDEGSSSMSSTYSLDQATSRDFFDHLNGRHDYSNPSSPTSYGASSLQRGFPVVVRQAYNMDSPMIAQKEARHQPVSYKEPPKAHHLALSRFIPKICRPKRSATPKSEATSHRRGAPPQPRNGTDWRHVAVKAHESEDEDPSPPRVLRLPQTAKPMKTTEEMQKWLDEARIADRPLRNGTPAVSNDPNSQLPSPTFSEPSSEHSASTASVQTLTSQKSTRISRRLKGHILLPEEEPIPQSKVSRAHDKCVAWNLAPNHRDSRDLQHESMLSISSSDDESRISRDCSSSSKPVRSIVNFSKPRLSRRPSANPPPERPQPQRVDLRRTQQDSFQSTDVGSPNPWHWSGAIQSGTVMDQFLRPPSARRKSVPNVISTMDSVSIDLAIDPIPGHGSPPRRLMAVTKHEERLLEAMREKRASMRAESSVGDDASAWSHKSESPRPKTAGGLMRSPTILHGTDVSSFPSPPTRGSTIFSRAVRTTTVRPELRTDLTNKSYLASVHSLESPLLVASESTALARLTTRFDKLPPGYLHSPVSEVSLVTPAMDRLPIEVVTAARGVGVKADRGLGIHRVSTISSRISLKSGEGELVRAIEGRERDGDATSDEEEDLVIWAMEVSVH